VTDEEILALKNALRSPKATPHFLYLPKKSKLAVVIEFFASASAREKRALFLKSQRAQDPVVGSVAKLSGGKVTFRVKGQKIHKELAPDLKKLIPVAAELAEAHVGLLGEESSESIRTYGTLKSKVKKFFSGSEQEVDEDDEEGLDEDLLRNRQEASEGRRELEERADELKEALLREEERVTELAQEVRDHSAVEIAEEDAERVALVRKQVDRDWGLLTAALDQARKGLAALDTDLGEVTDEYKRFTSERKKELRRRIAEAKQTGIEAEGRVAALIEVTNRLAALVDNLYERETRLLLTPENYGVNFVQPEEPEVTVHDDRLNLLVDRVNQEIASLSTDPLFDHMVGKARLLQAVGRARPEGVLELETWRSALTMGLLHTRLDENAARAYLTEANPARAVKGLIGGGRHDGSDVRRFFERAQSVVSAADRLATQKKGGLVWEDTVRRKFVEIAKVDGTLIGKDVVHDSQSGSVVGKSSTRRVAVAGGGPVGLLSAIEARMRGAEVTVYEGRAQDYSRGNVLKLDTGSLQRMVKAGIGHVLTDERGRDVAPSVREVENAAFERARALGVAIERGLSVVSMEEDTDTNELVITLNNGVTRADLLIVAVGTSLTKVPTGHNQVSMAQALGVEVSALDVHEHAVATVFTPPTEDDERERVPESHVFDPLEKAEVEGEDVVILEGSGGTKYRLGTTTPENFERMAQDRNLLEAYVLERATRGNRLHGLVIDPKNMGQFRITLQRVDRAVVPEKRAVLVGDSVSSPNPMQGSGVNTGIAEIHAIGDLVAEMVRRAGRGEQVKTQGMEATNDEVQKVGSRNTELGVGAMQTDAMKRLRGFHGYVEKRLKALAELPTEEAGLLHAEATLRLSTLLSRAVVRRDLGAEDKPPAELAARVQAVKDLQLATTRLATVCSDARQLSEEPMEELRALHDGLGPILEDVLTD
jgi:2-polyprenyl-6-methoxyphenol hydroxylase-like FAD-dependent oxidoreductase